MRIQTDLNKIQVIRVNMGSNRKFSVVSKGNLCATKTSDGNILLERPSPLLMHTASSKMLQTPY